MLKRVDHVNLVVRDLDQAKKFFVDLGFEEIDHATLSGEDFSRVTGLSQAHAKYAALSLRGAETKLELIQYIYPPGVKSAETGKANQIGLRHLAFEVDDIHAEVQRLKARGFRFQSGIEMWKRSGKRIVYFQGPEGILLELAQYPIR